MLRSFSNFCHNTVGAPGAQIRWKFCDISFQYNFTEFFSPFLIFLTVHDNKKKLILIKGLLLTSLFYFPELESVEILLISIIVSEV